MSSNILLALTVFWILTYGKIYGHRKWMKYIVYRYPMTSYEVLIGRIPFGDLLLTRENYDIVFRGQRLLLLDYVHCSIQELLKRCSGSCALKRPLFHEIASFVWDGSLLRGRTWLFVCTNNFLKVPMIQEESLNNT